MSLREWLALDVASFDDEPVSVGQVLAGVGFGVLVLGGFVLAGLVDRGVL